MIAVSTDTIATEKSRETAASRHHLLRDTHLVLWLRLTDDKFADLYYCQLLKKAMGRRFYESYLDFCVGDSVATNSGVASSLQALEENVLAPSIPISGVDILHVAHLTNISVVVTLEWLSDQVTQENKRTRGGSHQVRQIFTLKTTVLRIFLLTGMENNHVDHLTIHVEGGVNGRS